MFMYNGYSSYDTDIQKHIICNSTCTIFPSAIAEKTLIPCIAYIHDLIVTNRPFSVTTDKDMKWLLEIFSFGFTCEDSSIYQLCANVYVEWLKVFDQQQQQSNNNIEQNVPACIPSILREKTEFYWSQMFWHLYHLFVIHDEKNADLLTKRMYSHKVLRQLQTMISQTELTFNLWNILLQVFLAIGDAVLAMPYRTNEEGSAILSHRLVPSIYQVWLVACKKMNPSPGLWRTFRDYAYQWRHRPAVIYDWAQLCCVLSSYVVNKFCWPDYVPVPYTCTETDQGDFIQKIIDSFDLYSLVTTWLKFLTILRNPADCGDVSIFLRMPRYVNALESQNSGTKAKDFTSLQELPKIFVNATKAVAMFVDIWLGKEVDPTTELYSPKPVSSTGTSSTPDGSSLQQRTRDSVRVPPPPPLPPSILPYGPDSVRSKVKSQSDRKVSMAIAPSFTQSSGPPAVGNSTVNSSISNMESTSRILRINRPTVNSLFHLYGPYVLDACLLLSKERQQRYDITLT
ncbi:unnamed protein product [Didymodactylos carnosus]|uniref:Ral GTPase-activating protein subunit alpha/beta N-terminal domain-containing protein n=1 Tax=Didymodactylos carnosus TaxID=1234261 RepID=A0A814BLF8_9BILA|nr:unnamed protein product [Didymodactylos carnosus]CAF3707451.1 unnamed protein product [Didymodactylos carnosus]